MSVERRLSSKGRVRWLTRWREGGKAKTRVFDRRQDALAWQAEVRRRRQLGELGMLEHGRKKLSELHDAWLETHAQDLAPKTVSLYEGAWRKYIEPNLGGAKLVEIGPMEVERFARSLLSAGVGETVVEKCWLLLSSMFNRAVAWGWVARNPVKIATKPKKKKAKREPRVLSPVEIERVRSHLPQRDACFVAVLGYAGLRPGEALALKWTDVEEAHISVTKGLSMGELRTTKTGKSRRVPLIGPLRQELLQWRLASKHSRDSDPVFPNFKGEYWTEPDTRVWAGRFFKPALKASGIVDPVRTYDLRHSYISTLIASGLNPLEVARRAGHAPSMTLDVYGSVYEQWEGKRIDVEEEVRKAMSALKLAEAISG